MTASDGKADSSGTCPRIAPHLVTREIGGETVVLPVRRGAVDINSLFVLNVTGALLWNQIDGARTVEDLVNLLVARFEVPPDTVRKDIEEFLAALRDSGLILSTMDDTPTP